MVKKEELEEELKNPEEEHEEPEKNKDKVICTSKMSEDECENETINAVVAENMKLQKDKNNSVTPEINKIISVLEEFLISKKLICYGGTAINNILPKKAQFYDRTKEVPDYDFYTTNGIDDCIELADLYYKKGYKEVEAKSGFHFNTFKVFVNQIPIADITYLEESLFKSLQKESIVIAGIYYSSPNWLRMNMYLELSRPTGFVERWPKVFKRLNLLNKYCPLKIPKQQIDDCIVKSFYPDSLSLKILSENKTDIYENIHYLVRDSLIEQSAVFFGPFAASFYLNIDSSSEPKKTFMQKSGNFNVFHDDIDKCSMILQAHLKQNKIKNIKVMRFKKIIDMFPETLHILYENTVIASISSPVACHNYNSKIIANKQILIATIDTILNFLILFSHVYPFPQMKQQFMCISAFLFDLEEKYRINGKGILKRFGYTCIGFQPTMDSVRIEKTVKFKELSKDTKSLEYRKWFLKYNPEDEIKLHKNNYPITNIENKKSNKKRPSHNYNKSYKQFIYHKRNKIYNNNFNSRNKRHFKTQKKRRGFLY